MTITKHTMFQVLSAALLACAVAACGGGSASTDTASPGTDTGQGTSGKLDAGFGEGGKVVVAGETSTPYDFASSFAADKDGNLLIAGSSYGTGGVSLYAAKLDSSGKPVTAFGNGGRAKVAIDNSLLNSQRVVVAMTAAEAGGVYLAYCAPGAGTPDQLQLFKLDAAGKLSAGFGTSGKITVSACDFRKGFGLARDASGNLYISAAGDSIVVSKLDAAGRQASDYGIGGARSFKIAANSDDSIYAVALDSKNNLYIAGSSNGGSGIRYGMAIARLNAGGNLDQDFANGGTATLPFGSQAVAQALAVGPSGKVYLAGYTRDAAGAFSVALAKLEPNGVLASDFVQGSSTVLSQDSASPRIANALALDTQENLYVAGTGQAGSRCRNDFVAAKFNSHGSLLADFGQGGKSVVDFGNGDLDDVSAAVLDASGHLYLAGSSSSVCAVSVGKPTVSFPAFAIARLFQ